MALTVKTRNAARADIDAGAVRAAVGFLADPSAGLGMRTWPKPRTAVIDGDDVVRAASEAALMAGTGDGQSVYYNANPVPRGFARPPGKAVRDQDVSCRRWLPIDVDPVRAEGFDKHSATAAEKEAAHNVAGMVVDWLGEQGWPAPVLIDSGNGWHVLYRVDLPNDKHASLLCRDFLRVLARNFDGPGGKIGVECYNAGRVLKLPGTFARKGPDTPERPHRMCRVAFCPESPEVVPAEMIADVAGHREQNPGQPERPSPERTPLRVKAKNAGSDGRAYARKALDGECARVIAATPGGSGGEGRNNVLYKAAANMGELIAAGAVGRQEVEQALRSAAERCGLHLDDNCGPRGIEATIRSGVEKGMLSPRQIPERNGTHSAAEAVPAGESIIIRASSVVPKKVEWLWPYRLPLAKLTTFAGQGGLGKTFVICDIAARVSRGRDWPDGQAGCEAGQTLIITGEDDPDDTLVPRLIEAGADLDRVCFLRFEAQDKFTLADLPMLDRAAGEIGRDLRLIAIDPPASFLGEADDHKNAEVRALLSPLKSWCARHRIATLFNTHLNKASGVKIDAMMRVMGSVAWVNAVRAAHIFARDPEDRTRRFFIPMKMNIGKERKGLAYRLTETHDELAKVEWLGEIDTTADEAANRERGKPRKVVAAEWLVERFREKLEWPSDDLFRDAKATGISRDAVFEAKEKLQLPKARKLTLENGNTVWVWWVPADWPQLSQPVSGSATVAPLATLGPQEEAL